MVDKPFLRIPGVPDLLDISVERAYQMAARGEFPSVRLSPRRIRIPQRALSAWVDRQIQLALENREPIDLRGGG